MGILRSVGTRGDHPTVGAILLCLGVGTDAQYTEVCNKFDVSTQLTQKAERHDVQKTLFMGERSFDRPVATQLVARLQDENGHHLEDFDFLLTAWDPDATDPAHRRPDPNLLPGGFFVDRQRNRRHQGTVTYYVNTEVMHQAKALGVCIVPRPAPDPNDRKKSDFFVHYLQAEFAAKTKTLIDYVKPNQTLMLDIVMKRVVREGLFQLERVTDSTRPRDFTKDPPGTPIAD